MINKMDLINSINECRHLDSKKQEAIHISLVADKIFTENFKGMSQEEFFAIPICELEDIIIPYLQDENLLDIVIATLTTYFDY